MVSTLRRMHRPRLERRRDALLVRARAALAEYLEALQSLLTVEQGIAPHSPLLRHEAVMRMRSARARWLVEQRALAHLLWLLRRCDRHTALLETRAVRRRTKRGVIRDADAAGLMMAATMTVSGLESLLELPHRLTGS